MLMRPTALQKSSGFTLIEVLVTMVIICFGMLGLAGLILKGHQASSEAYQRNQALILANDIAEKMKTNRNQNGQLNSGFYIAAAPVPGVGSAPVALTLDCSTTTCLPAQIAVYDVQTWTNLLAGTQETSTATANANVGGIVNARGCIEASGANGQARISVAWQGIQSTTAPPGTLTCGQGAYAPDSTRRLVYIDVQ
jgi:type IV pilus assembly protein PilV